MTLMNTTKTHHIIRMLNFNLEMTRNPNKKVFFLILGNRVPKNQELLLETGYPGRETGYRI